MKLRLLPLLPLFLFVFLTPQEAQVSAIAKPISLQDLIKKSEAIVIAKSATPDRTLEKQAAGEIISNFEVLEIIKPYQDIAVGKTIQVRSADADLFKMIAELQAKGAPTPIPEIDTYESKVEWQKPNSEVILFLALDSKKRLRFTCNGSVEDKSKKAEVLHLLVQKN